MITNLMCGAGIKIVSNLLNTWMANRADEVRGNSLKDQRIIQAHVQLAKESNRDRLGKVSRSIIFFMLIATWCYMGVWGIHNPDVEMDVLVNKKTGFLGRLFNRTEFDTVRITGSVLLMQWFEIMEMVVGFFVVPSRKR